VDISGRFPRDVGGYGFLYVIIYMVTKWLKATPVVTINKQSTINFIKSIVCRFRAPNHVVADHDT
jgi:hypothetical protein